MEKAILKTLIYADIFDYPLKINEIHKWLVGPPAGRAGRKADLIQIEKAIKKKSLESRVKSQGNYYFLSRRQEIVNKRVRKSKQSESYFRKAKIISYLLKIIPWIKLVGVSGALAMGNAGKKDDIDLVFITQKNRLWTSRLLILGLLSLLGQRRKRQEKARKIAGKICCNILLEEDKLEQTNKDLYTAHEVLQMKVLWQRDGIYSKYLEDNQWAFKFLPNWVGKEWKKENGKWKIKKNNSQFSILNSQFNFIEILAKKIQLWYMKQPEGLERIEDGALYFHPTDCRQKVLTEYKKRLTGI